MSKLWSKVLREAITQIWDNSIEKARKFKKTIGLNYDPPKDMKLSGVLREAFTQIRNNSIEKACKFSETIELQTNYAPQKDMRFIGSVRLPHIPRPKMKVCMLGDAERGGEGYFTKFLKRSSSTLTPPITPPSSQFYFKSWLLVVDDYNMERRFNTAKTSFSSMGVNLGILELHDHGFIFDGNLERIVITFSKTGDLTPMAKLTIPVLVEQKDFIKSSVQDTRVIRKLMLHCLHYDKLKRNLSIPNSYESSWDPELQLLLDDLDSPYMNYLPPSVFLDHPSFFTEEFERIEYHRKTNLEMFFKPGYQLFEMMEDCDSLFFNSMDYRKTWKIKLWLDSLSRKGWYKDVWDTLSVRFEGVLYGDVRFSYVPLHVLQNDLLRSRLFKDLVRLPYDMTRHMSREIPTFAHDGVFMRFEGRSVDMSHIFHTVMPRGIGLVHSTIITKFGEVLESYYIGGNIRMTKKNMDDVLSMLRLLRSDYRC